SVPFAAQSREEPVPYSFPAITMSGVPARWYSIDASKMVTACAPGAVAVHPPSVPGASSLRSRILAKVPRIITSWLPRRDPYELKPDGFTPCAISHLPAGLDAGMEPAGEM